MKTSLSPAWRDLLHAWPAGEVREHQWYSLRWVKGKKDERVRVSPEQLGRAETRGLVTLKLKESPDPNQSEYDKVYHVTRTKELIRPYTSRGPNPKYDGPFPWGVEEHWRRMLQAPARAVRGITEQLTGVSSRRDDDFWETHYRYPHLVNSKTELANFRHTLLHFFTEGEQSSRRMQWGWVPQPLKFMLLTGIGMQLLFLDMLIRPVFDGEKFERFMPVDGNDAEREITRLVGNTGNLREKYQQYVERETAEVA